MSEINMPKNDNNNLLKPDSAVENFLDTLLQESTEKLEVEKPARLKSKLLLIPELELEPSTPEVVEDLVSIEKVAIETDEALVQIYETPIKTEKDYEYKFPLQCLMFCVAGNQLSIPIINMGSVLTWGNRLTMLPGAPDWFLGILKHRDMNVKIADTAKIIQISKNKEQQTDSQHILVFGDDNWAITCDTLGDVIKLNEEDVKWSKQSGHTLSLGTIKQSLAILLDPDKILKKLNKYESDVVL